MRPAHFPPATRVCKREDLGQSCSKSGRTGDGPHPVAGTASSLGLQTWCVRSVPLIAGVLYAGISNFKALYPSLLLAAIKSVANGVFAPWWWRVQFSAVGHGLSVLGVAQTRNVSSLDCTGPRRLNRAPLLNPGPWRELAQTSGLGYPC